MQVVLSDADLQSMPRDLRDRFVTHFLSALEVSATEEPRDVLNGYRYGSIWPDLAPEESRVVILNEAQVDELQSDLVRKLHRAVSAFERAVAKEDLSTANTTRVAVDEIMHPSALLNLLVMAERSEQSTPAVLAAELKLPDARQIGPLLNSINKSIQKLARNPTASLFAKDKVSGGYVMHPETRRAFRARWATVAAEL